MFAPKFLLQIKIILVLSMLAIPASATGVLVENVRAAVDGDRTRVVFDLDAAVTYRMFYLSEPQRVVIDFENTKAAANSLPRFFGLREALIMRLRYGVREQNNLRVVLDLSRKATAKVFQLEPLGKFGNRLVVDLSDPGFHEPLERETEVNLSENTENLERRSNGVSKNHTQKVIGRPLGKISPSAGGSSSEERVPTKSKNIESNAKGSWMSAIVSAIDDKMGEFNPAGNYLKKPIERAIPNLELTGFVRQSSDMLLTKSGRVGSREQDYRFLQLQNLFELQADYHVTDGVDIRAIGHFLYDGVYDLQDSSGLFADEVSDSAELYNTSERVLRELFVSYRKLGFDLKIGKQQIAWGKMDGQFIDLINGMDRRESLQLEASDYETRRIPTWMLNSTFYLGKTTIQGLYIFDFENDRQPELGGPWSSPLIPSTNNNIVLNTVSPKYNRFRDHEYALRIDRVFGALTYGAIYMYGWDKNPVNHVVGTALNNGSQALRVQPRYERLHHFGLTADYAMTFDNVPVLGNLPTIFRVESLYTRGVRFSDSEKQDLALTGVTTDGTSEHDTIRAAIAIEFSLPQRTTLLFQPSWYQTINYKKGLGPGFGGGFGAKWTLIPVVFFARPFASSGERLWFDVTMLPAISGSGVGWGGLKTKVRMSYDVSQFVKARMVYTGYDFADNTDIFGAYGKWDNLGWELSYEF